VYQNTRAVRTEPSVSAHIHVNTYTYAHYACTHAVIDTCRCTQTEREREREREKDRLTDRQTDRQTEGESER